MIIGQNKILNLIDNSTIDKFPHSLILLGDKGSGKHSIVNYIAEKYNLTLCDITDKLSLELIDEINLRVEPYLYLINGSSISIKDQNTILKFIEEPLKNSFIIIIIENKMQLLNTVINRCQCWQLQLYSNEVLSRFTDNQIISDIVNTPGKVLALNSIDSKLLNSTIDLANKTIDKISNANVSNILTIPNKINFSDNKELIDIDLFADILIYVINNKIKSNYNSCYIKVYELTNKFRRDLYINHVNKQYIFEHYLLDLKSLMRGFANERL